MDWPEKFGRLEEIKLEPIEQRTQEDGGKRKGFLARFLVDRSTSSTEVKEESPKHERTLGILFSRKTFNGKLGDEQGSELKSFVE
jgi:hypothetical protein